MHEETNSRKQKYIIISLTNNKKFVVVCDANLNDDGIGMINIKQKQHFISLTQKYLQMKLLCSSLKQNTQCITNTMNMKSLFSALRDT